MQFCEIRHPVVNSRGASEFLQNSFTKSSDNNLL